MRLGVHGITAAHLVNVDDDHHHPSVEPMGGHWGGRADRDRDLSVPWRNTSRCAHHRLFILPELPKRPRNDCDPWRPVEPRWCWRIHREFRTSCTLHRGLRSCVHEDPFHGAPRALPCGRCRDRSSGCRRGTPWRGRQSGGRIANRPHAVGSARERDRTTRVAVVRSGFRERRSPPARCLGRLGCSGVHGCCVVRNAVGTWSQYGPWTDDPGHCAEVRRSGDRRRSRVSDLSREGRGCWR